MVITCCRGCVAPKRHPGCHSSCQEYIVQKAEHERLKKKYDEKNRISNAIEMDRAKRVYNAMKNRRIKRI